MNVLYEFLPHNAILAYLDPGSGAIIVQALVAGVAGAVVFFKYQGRRIKAFFGFGPKSGETNDDSDTAT